MHYQEELENKVLQGSCIIFTNKYIKFENVAFEPDTKFYFEEMLLASKCLLKNYSTLYTPSLKIIHNHGLATKFKFKSYKEYRYNEVNMMLSALKIYKEYISKNI